MLRQQRAAFCQLAGGVTSGLTFGNVTQHKRCHTLM
jgi:hypothetical protein